MRQKLKYKNKLYRKTIPAFHIHEEDYKNNNENSDDNQDQNGRIEIDKKAPIAISGNNVYIAGFNDQNTSDNNPEVLFRSSSNGGVTFSDKINPSNTTIADSINAEISADGNDTNKQ